jgi:signal peptide peptidase SppA
MSEHPWAILPARLDSIIEVLELRVSGQIFTDEEIQARIGARARPAAPPAGAVAVLPLHGLLAPRMNAMTDISGGTSAEAFGRTFRAAIADPDIAAVILDVDSPGGSVFGIEELAAVIRGGRGRKPIVAVANTLMASAAYWIASQADEILASPSSQVGSIGVIGVHTDISEAEAKAGIKTTLITAGKFKADGNEHAPLTDSARATMQQLVDSYYAVFVRDIARGRAVTEHQVRDGMGEGQILGAKDALKAGLVDGIGTLDHAIVQLASGSKRVALAAAAPFPRLGAPLPMPHQNEDKETFIDRCMGDGVMNQEFEDPAQRRAVCESQWDKGGARALGGEAAAEEIANFRRRLAELAG